MRVWQHGALLLYLIWFASQLTFSNGVDQAHRSPQNRQQQNDEHQHFDYEFTSMLEVLSYSQAHAYELANQEVRRAVASGMLEPAAVGASAGEDDLPLRIECVCSFVEGTRIPRSWLKTLLPQKKIPKIKGRSTDTLERQFKAYLQSAKPPAYKPK